MRTKNRNLFSILLWLSFASPVLQWFGARPHEHFVLFLGNLIMTSLSHRNTSLVYFFCGTISDSTTLCRLSPTQAGITREFVGVSQRRSYMNRTPNYLDQVANEPLIQYSLEQRSRLLARLGLGTV